MRLVDADALKKMNFSNGLNENGILYVPFGEVMRNIENAPTIYNKEKNMRYVVRIFLHQADLSKYLNKNTNNIVDFKLSDWDGYILLVAKVYSDSPM